MADLVWSDPVPLNSFNSDYKSGFMISPRGAGYVFGKEVTRKFLEMNNLSHICRAHQLCMEGYQNMFDDMLSTVWSAPNYCYRAGNMASILEIGPSLDRFVNVFGPCPVQDRFAPIKKFDSRNGPKPLRDPFDDGETHSKRKIKNDEPSLQSLSLDIDDIGPFDGMAVKVLIFFFGNIKVLYTNSMVGLYNRPVFFLSR